MRRGGRVAKENDSSEAAFVMDGVTGIAVAED